jgi:hypothetical protein
MTSTLPSPFQPDAMTPGPAGGCVLSGPAHRPDPHAVPLPAAPLVHLVLHQRPRSAGWSSARPTSSPTSAHFHDAGLRDSLINTNAACRPGVLPVRAHRRSIAADPAVYARLPKIQADETRPQGLDWLKFIRFLQVALL